MDPKASESEIKRAFRKKAIREHPDKGGDPEKVSRLVIHSSKKSPTPTKSSPTPTSAKSTMNMERRV